MMDKRIERARARHELAHLVMGTIFKSYYYINDEETQEFPVFVGRQKWTSSA